MMMRSRRASGEAPAFMADKSARSGGGKPVYRYFYSRVRPRYLGMPGDAAAAGAGGGGRGRGAAGGSGRGGGAGRGPNPFAARPGAAHSAEIQYAMGNLDLDNRYAWDADDHKVSDTMQAYFANFIKTFNPNGAGLPEWPAYGPKSNFERMHIDVDSKAEVDPSHTRYPALNAALMPKQ